VRAAAAPVEEEEPIRTQEHHEARQMPEYEGPPGPGSYHMSRDFGASAPKVGIQSPYRHASRKRMAGSSSEPQLVLANRFGEQDSSALQWPGPMAYQPKATKTGELTSPQVTFPRSPTHRGRLTAKEEQPQGIRVPTPGHYDKVYRTRYGKCVAYQEERQVFDAPAHPFSKEPQTPPDGIPARFMDKRLSSGPVMYGRGDSPGPLKYEKLDALGTTWKGHPSPNAPQFTMAPRLPEYQPPLAKLERRQLDPIGAFGKQVQAKCVSEPNYRFGSGPQRFELGKRSLYMGKEQERETLGKDSVQIASSQGHSTEGLWQSASQKNGRRFGFSQESRF